MHPLGYDYSVAASSGAPEVWQWLIPAVLVFAGAILGQVLAGRYQARVARESGEIQARLARENWEMQARAADLREIQEALDRCGEVSNRKRPYIRRGEAVPDDLMEAHRQSHDRMEALQARIADKRLEQCWEVWIQKDVLLSMAQPDDRDAWRETFNASTDFHKRVGELLHQ